MPVYQYDNREFRPSDFYGNRRNTSYPPKEESQWPYYTEREPEPFYKQSLTKLAGLGLLGGGLIGSGFISLGPGRNIWDYYVKGLQHIEEYSPGGILRTFQLSTFFSQFRKTPEAGFFIEPELFYRNQDYRTLLAREIGTNPKFDIHNRLIAEGVTLKNGKLYWGQGEEVALEYASAIRQPIGVTSRLGAARAQALGWEPTFNSREQFLSTATISAKKKIFNPSLDNEVLQIIGGRTRGEYISRQISSIATEGLNRFNRLLQAPFEMEPFKTVFQGINTLLESTTGRQLSFAVKQDVPLKMFGSLAMKYGVGLGLAALGYQTIDWMFKSSSIFDNTLLGEGLTAGVATMGVKANLALSQLAEVTGLHAYREKQEEMAPGSTSLQKLLAFPMMGSLVGGLAGYLVKPWHMAKLQINEGLSPAQARQTIVDEMSTFKNRAGVLSKLARQLTTKGGLYSRQDTIGKIFRKIATSDTTDDLTFKFVGKVGHVKLLSLIGAAAGAALIAPFLPGALVPSQRPEELEAIYSGRKEVPIRKGRWWEFGRSAYEGERIMYYRPHWYPRMLAQGREKAIWGPDEEQISPLSKWFQKEFTYNLEQQHYQDRPYPITSLPFEDVPLIGPLLANTLGRIIKPPQYMHQEEWMGPGGSQLAQPPGYGKRLATEMGELPASQAISPYDIRSTISQQAYRMTEMVGLPGFVTTSIKESLTGTPDLFDQYSQLESARRIAGMERSYWDLEIGGGLGTTEVFRRLYPHRQRQIPLYNPIRNTMPSWLPGEGAKGPDLLHGDPYTKVQEGELRLPGAGYESRFPELKGIKPEDYPLIHKYKILGDVAPYTDQFKEQARAVAYKRKYKEDWTDYEEAIYQQTKEQLAAKKEKKTFSEYQYLSPMGSPFGEPTYYRASGAEDSTNLLTALNEMRKSNEQKPGLWTSMFGGYWEMLAHNAETAFDQLTPISPGAKLVHTRTPIETYEREQLYGTQNAFWNRPYENFIRPFTSLLGRSVGITGVPDAVQSKRDLEEYFDVLEYVKASKLANEARNRGDWNSVSAYEQQKNQTLIGVNPFTYNFSNIFKALPRSSKDFYNAFTGAKTEEERERILEMVPENEKALYAARWRQQFIADFDQAKKKGILTEEQIEAGELARVKLKSDMAAEGQPYSEELYQEYLSTRLPGENYADWYRRTYLLSKYTLPGQDWVGWNPHVDLDDIKLKVVQNMGESMQEYDLWADRAQTLGNKPYIDEAAISPILHPESLSEVDRRQRVQDLLGDYQSNKLRYNNTTVRMIIEQDNIYEQED